MHWSHILLAALAGLDVAHAHSHDEPIMNIIRGRRGPDALRRKRAAYEAWNPPSVPLKPREESSKVLETRDQALPAGIKVGDGSTCGKTAGACKAGQCCSSAGWCGTGPEYCSAPDCQISYGPACDGNKKPNGPDTSNDARPKRGSVPYGGLGIYSCVKDGDIAITFDDGPYKYTAAMLDAFKAHGAVATWYITGNNIGKGMINVAYRDVIKRMVAEGHQIASHTWSHENLDQMTLSQRKNQMVYNEIAFTDILGFYPTYMRPPFSICGTECQGQMADLGYHITYFDLDTQGYLHTEPSRISVSNDLWDAAMLARSPCNASYLHIEHDIHQQVAETFTPHMLDSLVKNGWKAVTVGECLGDPVENWYRRGNPGYNFKITAATPPVCSATGAATSKTSGASSRAGTASSAAASATSTNISKDATCGGTSGYTCKDSAFGSCCSVNGWCGSTAAYCGTGCQSKFGTCTNSDTVSSAGGAGSGSSATKAASGALPSSTLPVSSIGECGAKVGQTCLGFGQGTCCSQYNYCGNTEGHCGAGCQSGFGTCNAGAGTSSAASAAAPASSNTANKKPSTDGTCGASNNGFNCLGTAFGDCCSPYGFCGTTSGHCDTGCQSGYGKCSGTGADTNVSRDGKCGDLGSTLGQVLCQGSAFGNCCSAYGFCGSTDAHCGTGCQSKFGTCSMSIEVTSTESQLTSSILPPANTVSQKPETSTASSSVRSSVNAVVSTSSSRSNVPASSSSRSTTLATTSKTSSASVPTQTAKPIKTVNRAGDTCGESSAQKCGTGLCCTSRGVCANTRSLWFNNSSCYKSNGCKVGWGTCF
ncbi:chitin recognition protein [Colletotrichum truncatum]|uniref:Chitin recognition protein n=1 Tax=Colletotrichum truncatum TaxID=5467 RepID=A0ACC3YJL9_COLTU|nr:chitin recognition protein [Colletotrichum truncatum]KAF6797280.1 chitin recognition protein [Colletotrichum truncatum]